MANRPTYQAAHTASPAIERHFTTLLAAAMQRGDTDLAPAPPRDVIEAVIDAAFWASLRKEEGREPKISLAYLPPELAGQPLMFGQPIRDAFHRPA